MNDNGGAERLACCGSCKFSATEGPLGAQQMFCVRYPPAVFPAMNAQGQVQTSSFWPPVLPTMKCGEYARNILVAHDMPSSVGIPHRN